MLVLLLALTGCSALLERSYSVVEPYTNRYWDSGVEDTLKAENSQELVNSLLLLVEERAEEGVIRCYTEQNPYFLASTAAREVQRETMLGSYLLKSLTFDYELGDGYCTLTYQMVYRDGTEDVDSLLLLSDSQSLADMLRVAVREGHPKVTARFICEIPQADVMAAVEGLWQELYRAQLPQEELQPVDGEETVTEPSGDSEEAAAAQPEPVAQAEAGMDPEEPAGEELPPIDYPPCPWVVNFYPDLAREGIVEILLKKA